MSKLREQVREFMVAFSQPIRETPGVPDDDEVVRLRIRLIAEEFFELLSASVDYDASSTVRSLREDTMDLLDSDLVIDLPQLTDALGDLDYVVEGTRLTFGIDGGPIADAIHASNLSKADGAWKDEYGKIRKGPNWKAPDILGELQKQGFTQ